MNNILLNEDRAVQKLFPHISNHISGRTEDTEGIQRERARTLKKKKQREEEASRDYDQPTAVIVDEATAA